MVARVTNARLLVKVGPGESSLISKAMNRYSGAANRTKPVAQQKSSTALPKNHCL